MIEHEAAARSQRLVERLAQRRIHRDLIEKDKRGSFDGDTALYAAIAAVQRELAGQDVISPLAHLVDDMNRWNWERPTETTHLLLPPRSSISTLCRFDTTGAVKVYDAAIALAVHLRAWSAAQEIKVWVELGAGFGFTSLDLVKHANLKEDATVIITDGEEYLVQTAAINYMIMKQEKAQLPKVLCKRLLWGDVELDCGEVDVVFAADVLYWSTEAVPALVATIHWLQPKHCFFSWERRPLHDDCVELFLSLMQQENCYEVKVSTIVEKQDDKGEIFLAHITYCAE